MRRRVWRPVPPQGTVTVVLTVARALLDLVLPTTCPGCGTEGALLCPACEGCLDRPPTLAVPSPCPPGLPTTWAAAEYDGPVRSLLLAHKESGRLGLAGPLGAALARAAAVPGVSPLVLVPVPSAPRTVRQRGHDHALRVARRAAAVLRAGGTASVAVPALRQARRVADQSGLDSAARADNLAGALEVRPAAAGRLDGRAVVVVDDVMTTGATMAEAARALGVAGVGSVTGAVVAATVRRTAASITSRSAGPGGGAAALPLPGPLPNTGPEV